MSPFRLIVGLLAVCAFAADTPLDSLLKAVEARYNHAKTLQVLFKEQYTPAGRPGRTESGLLMLSKPLKMRWDYSQPQGKLFISDGSNLWLYNAAEKRAEKMPLKESDDMRAPLAFLLGRLHFDKEFKNIHATPEGPNTRIAAEPKSDNLPYSKVDFLVAPDDHILELKVTYFDNSTLLYRFDQERMDPKLDAKLFHFELPPGATLETGQ
ncbi:MAG TPA: outer membrane lipoprotein carrier protein LolA [Candidatus Limnocylindrales bacterium]|nr:outer membrane lipoprotein carrier protein LolA [Candidatus Limnocylindrales bacterium]